MVVALSTLLLQLIGHDLWFLLPMLWAILPAANLFYFLRVPLIPPVEEAHRIPLKKLLTSRIFVVAMLLMVCSGAAEQACRSGRRSLWKQGWASRKCSAICLVRASLR